MRSEKVQKLLTDIIDNADETLKNGFETSDGLFSGAIVMTKERNFFENFLETLSIEPLQVDCVSKTDKNSSLSIFIAFTGEALDQDLNAHLSFDLEITDPIGKVETFKEMQGLQRKIPSPLLIQTTDGHLRLDFEKEDQLGVYKIKAALKDHISGKKLFLENSFELQDELKVQDLANY